MKNVVKSHCHCKKSTLAWVNHVQIVLRTRCHVKTYSRHLSQTLQTNQNKDNFFYTNQKKKVIIIQTIRTKVRWSQPSLNDDLCGPIRTKKKLIDQSERFITAESKWSVNITILSKFSQPSPNDHLISQSCHILSCTRGWCLIYTLGTCVMCCHTFRIPHLNHFLFSRRFKPLPHHTEFFINWYFSKPTLLIFSKYC